MPDGLFIVSPTPGEVLAGTDIKVSVKLPEGMRLVDPALHAENKEGQAHLHLWVDPVRDRSSLDDRTSLQGGSASNGVDALTSHDGTVSVVLTDTPEYTYTNAFSGLHTLHAELFQNDHAPFVPPIKASAEFETMGQPIKEVTTISPEIEVPPDAGGGLFIPRGAGNTTFAIIFVVLALAILWFVFERKHKDDSIR